MYTTPVWWLQAIGHVVLDVGHYWWWWWFSFVVLYYCNEPKNKGGFLSIIIIFLRWQCLRERFADVVMLLHVACVDGEKKRGKERRKKEERKKKKRRKKEEKNQLFCYILRPIFVGGACGGLYGRGALAPPHNPSDPTKLALRLISTHYSMLAHLQFLSPQI